MRISAVIAGLVLIAPAAFAQERGPAGNEAQAANEKRFVELAARVPLEAPVKGVPYSADVIVATSQTLADGNHISHQETSHVYRDGEGRTRREQGGQGIVSIADPVAGYSYSLDAEHKIAWRTPIGASQEVLAKLKASYASEMRGRGEAQLTSEQKAAVDKAKAEAASANEGREAKANAEIRAREGARVGMAYAPNNAPLEHATIDGLAVEGHKRSETIPVGKIGNELPITITSEEWRSPELKVLVLTKHNDPRTGESTYRLANIVRAEPDPSYFIVPADYTIKDTGIRRNELHD